MNTCEKMAQHLISFYEGGNSTGICLTDKIDDLSWIQATTQIEPFHNIATLVFHLGYYVSASLDVLSGKPLTAHDKFSFDLPEINTPEDWEQLKKRVYTEGKEVADLISAMPVEQLDQPFVKEEYGTYQRCLQGTIEHCYYHLGQISIVRTLVEQSQPES